MKNREPISAGQEAIGEYAIDVGNYAHGSYIAALYSGSLPVSLT